MDDAKIKKLKNNYDVEKYWSWRAKIGEELKDEYLSVLTFDPKTPLKNKVMDYTQKKLMAAILRNENLHDKRILEIGCGVGRWVNFFKERGAEYYGVDISPEMIRIITSKYKNIHVKRYTPNNRIDFPDNYFDYVFSITVIHHNPYEIQDHIIGEIARLLKKSGKVVILESININDNSFNMYPNTPDDWFKKFERHGLKLVEYRYIRYYILYSIIASIAKKLGFKRNIVDMGSKSLSRNANTSQKKVYTMLEIFRNFGFWLAYLDPYLMSFLPKKYAHAILAKFVKK